MTETTTNGATPSEVPDGLTRAQYDLLRFEGRWWRSAGAKQQAIRDEFGCDAIEYYQRLADLLDEPAALRAEPTLINRLRRVRDARRRARTERDPA
ncbi:DUF3263 domain-containing protein [Stackebrandtia soli]|uniref:DUF3263 domain-containing protein n=1 Tax=Stackebrandtia soli TaxID=1892856 RepID=UPI0039E98F22